MEIRAIFPMLFLSLFAVSSLASAQEAPAAEVKEVQPYVGIGAQMRVWTSSEKSESVVFVTISGFICGGPADRSGLKNLDLVMSIDGKLVGGDRMTVKGFEDVLRTITNGSIGAPVALVVDSLNEHGTTPREVTILREEFTNPEFSENCDE